MHASLECHYLFEPPQQNVDNIQKKSVISHSKDMNSVQLQYNKEA